MVTIQKNSQQLHRRSNSKSKSKGKKKGPVFDENGIPYDYIIIIDSGSKGSRAYVYNWLSAKYLVEHGVNVQLELAGASSTLAKPELVERFEVGFEGDQDQDDDGDYEGGYYGDSEGKSIWDREAKKGNDDVDTSDDETDDEDNNDYNNKNDKNEDKGKDNKKLPLSITHKDLLPTIHTRPEWRKKIKPGISSFKNSPDKVGKQHIQALLKAASQVVPKEQQYRTPIFLHATAGMRLLKPLEQFQILDNTCKYIQAHSNFYLPDCPSHINVINGDIEGLYGWIGLNYLMGSFNNPQSHNHGKNHHTYGLLDMGGASTQIAFQPNETEVNEHSNTLYKLQLASFGQEKADLSYNVFSSSFLGYGMYQSRDKYLSILTSEILSQKNKQSEKKLVINNPCLPKGLSSVEQIENVNNNYKFTVQGTGNFTACMNTLYPLLVSTQDNTKSVCDSENPQDVSSCLLLDSIPSLDFDIDRFVGVSGYWDSIGNLLNLKDNHNNAANMDEKYANAYKYESFYNRTAEVCNLEWKELTKLNDEMTGSNNSKKNSKDSSSHNNDNNNVKLSDLSDEELSELCFKSSWVLNVLHRGLGFPRYGIDENTRNAYDNKSSIHVAESINGSDFSWTLGRAVLYASSESAEAFSSSSGSSSVYGSASQTTKDNLLPDKIGFVHGIATDTFYYGGEAEGIDPRPAFVSASEYKNFKINESDDNDKGYDSDDDDDDDDDDDKFKWGDKLEEHRLWGSLVFLGLLLVIVYLLMGKKKRSAFYQSVRLAFTKRFGGFGRFGGSGGNSGAVYLRLDSNGGNGGLSSSGGLDVDLERDIELGEVTLEPREDEEALVDGSGSGSKKRDDADFDDRFKIDDE